MQASSATNGIAEASPSAPRSTHQLCSAGTPSTGPPPRPLLHPPVTVSWYEQTRLGERAGKCAGAVAVQLGCSLERPGAGAAGLSAVRGGATDFHGAECGKNWVPLSRSCLDPHGYGNTTLSLSPCVGFSYPAPAVPGD